MGTAQLLFVGVLEVIVCACATGSYITGNSSPEMTSPEPEVVNRK
jgi:hypothetical protein